MCNDFISCKVHRFYWSIKLTLFLIIIRRSYFRCSHKYDQGCQATKQVQRNQECPTMYQTTYTGIHTCSKATHSTTDSSNWESYLLNSDHDSILQDSPISSPTLTIKQEFLKDLTDHKPLEPSLLQI